MTEMRGGDAVPLWQRLLITLVVMLVTSYLAGLLWHWLFNSDIPSYLSGAVGGISAVPTWEFLQRVRPKPQGAAPCRGLQYTTTLLMLLPSCISSKPLLMSASGR